MGLKFTRLFPCAWQFPCGPVRSLKMKFILSIGLYFFLTLSALADGNVTPFPQKKVRPAREGRFSPGHSARLIDLQKSKCNLMLMSDSSSGSSTPLTLISSLARAKGISFVVAVISPDHFQKLVLNKETTLGPEVEFFPLYESLKHSSVTNVLLAENFTGQLEKGVGFIFPIEILDQRRVYFHHDLIDQPKSGQQFGLRYQDQETMNQIFESLIDQNIPKRLTFRFGDEVDLNSALAFWLPKPVISKGRVKLTDLQAFRGFDLKSRKTIHLEDLHPAWSDSVLQTIE